MNENIEKILETYKENLNTDIQLFDDFKANDYIKTLKDNDLNDEAIEVGRTFLAMRPDLKRYINQYGYALYNKFINLTDQEIKEKENLFFDILTEITDTCKQEAFSPVEPTINRAIKYLLHQNPIDYDKIIKLYTKLDFSLISDKPFINKNGIEFESRKERYFRIIIKAFFETKNYNQCLEYANYALAANLKWHNNNLNWVKYYRGCSLNFLGNFAEAEREFVALHNRIKGVNFYQVLYQNNKELGKIKEANAYLLYEFFLKGYNPDYIDLYQRILEACLTSKDSLMINVVSSFINKLIDENNLPVEKPLLDQKYANEKSDHLYDKMYDLIMNRLDKLVERKHGKIIYYNNDKLIGGISVSDGDPIFFKQADFVYDEVVEKRDYVGYTVLPTYDNKKNRVTEKAILILPEDNYTSFID